MNRNPKRNKKHLESYNYLENFHKNNINKGLNFNINLNYKSHNISKNQNESINNESNNIINDDNNDINENEDNFISERKNKQSKHNLYKKIPLLQINSVDLKIDS